MCIIVYVPIGVCIVAIYFGCVVFLWYECVCALRERGCLCPCTSVFIYVFLFSTLFFLQLSLCFSAVIKPKGFTRSAVKRIRLT